MISKVYYFQIDIGDLGMTTATQKDSNKQIYSSSVSAMIILNYEASPSFHGTKQGEKS